MNKNVRDIQLLSRQRTSVDHSGTQMHTDLFLVRVLKHTERTADALSSIPPATYDVTSGPLQVDHSHIPCSDAKAAVLHEVHKVAPRS